MDSGQKCELNETTMFWAITIDLGEVVGTGGDRDRRKLVCPSSEGTWCHYQSEHSLADAGSTRLKQQAPEIQGGLRAKT